MTQLIRAILIGLLTLSRFSGFSQNKNETINSFGIEYTVLNPYNSEEIFGMYFLGIAFQRFKNEGWYLNPIGSVFGLYYFRYNDWNIHASTHHYEFGANYGYHLGYSGKYLGIRFSNQLGFTMGESHKYMPLPYSLHVLKVHSGFFIKRFEFTIGFPYSIGYIDNSFGIVQMGLNYKLQ
ncbi:MAG: hypothetical protein KDC92_05940 [Bacteroidetes bacterium]|nr:hypothetical protein [Bacteroidota bacterium]